MNHPILSNTNTRQITNHLLMVRPAHFGYNPETEGSNMFQQNDPDMNPAEIEKAATKEFDNMVRKLEDAGISVLVLEDTDTPVKSDALFPNNWISFHENGIIVTYPMISVNRRMERREDIIEHIEHQFQVERRYSFEYYEAKNKFLEGTGSMVLDRVNKIIYACLSPRTDIQLVEKFAVLFGYSKCVFHAMDETGKDIYHTNVMMTIAKDFSIICLDVIRDPEEKKKVILFLEQTGKEIIEISHGQLYAFAGNMLQVLNKEGETYLIMSENAFKSLLPEQVSRIRKYSDLLYCPIPTIEKYGGGSVRCMIAEIFLPPKVQD